jgi:hypothetical protein
MLYTGYTFAIYFQYSISFWIKLNICAVFLVLTSSYHEKPFLEGQSTHPFVMMVIGRSGSTWVCSRITKHPCAICLQVFHIIIDCISQCEF